MHHIREWIIHYGYFAIFALLVLGVVGLPVPDETMLTLAGFLCYKGRLSVFLTIPTAFLGSSVGITISYYLGRKLGTRLLLKYGSYLHITPQRLDRAHAWFERSGKWTLTYGYFIPGVRHLTAYVAGTSNLDRRVFGIFAYTGALIWSTTFILLGYFLGPRWERVLGVIDRNLKLVVIAAVVITALYITLQQLIRRKKTRRKRLDTADLENAPQDN